MIFSVAGLSAQQVVEDFQPSSTNGPNRQYPMVNSQGMVRARINAPNANSVQLDIGGVRYDMVKDDAGVWTGTSAPQDVGFHYYQLNIDGANVPDPGTLFFYGASRWGSGIEIPSADQDFWQVKNVPQGSVSEVFYWSTYTETMRRCFVYLPNEYYTNPTKRYPVLYLQHGGGENEYGWPSQGHTGQIMDNLIAEGKAVPFIIVMDNGQQNVRRAGQEAQAPQGQRPAGAPQAGQAPQGQRPAGQAPQGQGGQRPGGFGMGGGGFPDIIIQDLIPMIEKKYRVIGDAQHRAMAGLSMGGMQTRTITVANPTKFAYVGLFSGGAISVADVQNNEGYKETNKLVFMSAGSKENPARITQAAEELKNIGINAVSYVSEGTAHEWHTWRRSLYQFAQLLFK
jgi:enterochelin esterase family protein